MIRIEVHLDIKKITPYAASETKYSSCVRKAVHSPESFDHILLLLLEVVESNAEVIFTRRITEPKHKPNKRVFSFPR